MGISRRKKQKIRHRMRRKKCGYGGENKINNLKGVTNMDKKEVRMEIRRGAAERKLEISKRRE